MGSGIIVKEVDSPEELRSVLMIREEVFVGEQHVPYGEEMDGREEESIHFIAFREGRPVGCARIRFPSDKAKIERLAVLGSDRGRGVGTALMRYMLEFIKKNRDKEGIFKFPDQDS